MKWNFKLFSIQRKAPNLLIDELINKIKHFVEIKSIRGMKTLINNNALMNLIQALQVINDINITMFFLLSAQKIKLGICFSAFDFEDQKKIIEEIKLQFLTKILDDLNADDVVDILNKLPKNLYKKVLFACTPELKNEIKKIECFDEAQVGSIMNTTILLLQEDWTIDFTLNYLKEQRNSFDIDKNIYVVSKKNKLVGKVKAEDLFFNNGYDVSLTEVMDKSFTTIYADDEIELVVDLFRDYLMGSIAVINRDNQIIGVIDEQDIIPEIFEETTDDVYKLYGISETAEPYLQARVWDIVKSRIFWLIIMLFAATLTTFVIDKFENLGMALTMGLSSAILVPIIPIITDTCGNTGSQTSATVIQAMATGDIKDRDFFKVVYKELKVSIVVGLILGIINFTRLLIYFAIVGLDVQKLKFSNANSIHFSKIYATCAIGALAASIALVMVVVLSKLIGACVPYLAIKFNLNPAVFSTPILTTILDAFGALIFFGIGILLIYLAVPILGGQPLTVSTQASKLVIQTLIK